MLGKMDRWDPKDAMEFLTTNDSGDDVMVQARDLDGLDAQEGARVLMQALVDKMVATAP